MCSALAQGCSFYYSFASTLLLCPALGSWIIAAYVHHSVLRRLFLSCTSHLFILHTFLLYNFSALYASVGTVRDVPIKSQPIGV